MSVLSRIKASLYACICCLLLLAIPKDNGAINIVLFFLCLLLLLFCVIYFCLMIMNPFRNIQNEIQKANSKNIAYNVLISSYDSNSFAQDLLHIIKQYADMSVRRNLAYTFSKQTELMALQSQINPHFLYNTLDSIRGEALLNDDNEVAEMIGTLASFFRYSISRKGNMVRLREEISNVKNYMVIQQYRFRNRFRMLISVSEEDEKAYDCYVPRLILQPIIENAIYHGLEDVQSGGLITIEISLTIDSLVIIIMDNGKGMSIENLQVLNEKIHSDEIPIESDNQNNQRNTGIALPNIHHRIQLLFGDKYGVDIYSSLGHGTDVQITLPKKARIDESIDDEDNYIENK